jgi:hypothetical protein
MRLRASGGYDANDVASHRVGDEEHTSVYQSNGEVHRKLRLSNILTFSTKFKAVVVAIGAKSDVAGRALVGSTSWPRAEMRRGRRANQMVYELHEVPAAQAEVKPRRRQNRLRGKTNFASRINPIARSSLAVKIFFFLFFRN